MSEQREQALATQTDRDNATELLRGAVIESVEFVSDDEAQADDLSGGYVRIRAKGHLDLTLYADAPTLYWSRLDAS